MNTAQAAANVGPLTATVVFGAFVMKLVDFVKYLVAVDVNGIVTQLVTWAVGFGAVYAFIQSQWGDEIMVGNEMLKDLSFFSQVILALAIPSLASLLYDAKKAVDNTDSAVTPPLVKPSA